LIFDSTLSTIREPSARFLFDSQLRVSVNRDGRILSRSPPAGLSGRTMRFQALAAETCTLSGVVNHAFP
jgi:hypothetical protein